MYDKQFEAERAKRIRELKENENLYDKGISWLKEAWDVGYAYNFNWLGVPIIKLPADIVSLQEIIFEKKPDVIIETGIARGGSIIFSASILKLVKDDYRVIGIDIDIREHAHKAISQWSDRLNMFTIEGSSVEIDTLEKVKALIPNDSSVMVILDSGHHHSHVLAELKLYSELVTSGQYLCCTDTFIEHFPQNYFENDGPGNSPLTAIHEFLETNNDFEVDKERSRKGLISENFDGYLLRTKNCYED